MGLMVDFSWSSSVSSHNNKRMVRAAGLEPARDYSQRILSPLRLPLRHARTKGLIGEQPNLDKRGYSSEFAPEPIRKKWKRCSRPMT